MSRRGALLFAAMCVIWGIPYLLIKVAVDEMSPSMLVLGRTAEELENGQLRGVAAPQNRRR